MSHSKRLREWPKLCRRGHVAYTMSILTAAVAAVLLSNNPWGGEAGWAAAVVVILWLVGIGFHVAAIVKGWKSAGLRGIATGFTLVPLLIFVTACLVQVLWGGL